MSLRSSRNALSSFFWIVTVVAIVAVGAISLALMAGKTEYIPKPVLAQVMPLQSKVQEFASEPSKLAPQKRHGHLGAPPAERKRYPHLSAKAGKQMLKVESTFRFEGKQYHITSRVPETLYADAVKADRRLSKKAGESGGERQRALYRYYAQDAKQAAVIDEFCKTLLARAGKSQFDSDRQIDFIAKYVQSLPLDGAKPKDSKTRFPIQTLVDGKGTSRDKALLLATLLAHEGYGVALLDFGPQRYMAVGIEGRGTHYWSTKYLFVEPTSPRYVSAIPKETPGGAPLKAKPLVVAFGTGDATYNAADEVARISKVRKAAVPAARKLAAETKGKVTDARAEEIRRLLAIANEAQYRLQPVEGKERKFLERNPALSWISDRAWWD